MRRVVNLYAGPSAGKSTIATGLFSSLKFQDRNIEYVSEFAKDITWEKRGPIAFRSQEHIFAEQLFRMERLVNQVDFMITDSPLLLGLAYLPSDYYLTSLEKLVVEAHSKYETLNYFIKRSPEKKYVQAGRSQTLPESIEKDEEIKAILSKYKIRYWEIDFSRESISGIESDIKAKGW